MVWSTEAMNSAIATIKKTRPRRGRGSSPLGNCAPVKVLGAATGVIAADRDDKKLNIGVRFVGLEETATLAILCACQQANKIQLAYPVAMDANDVARLRSVVNKLSRQFNLSATDEGLTPAQASALGLVAGEGPLGLAELTEIEGLNPTMVSRVVGHLDSVGLVRRVPHPNDLRSAMVEITPIGVETHARIRAARSEVVTEYLNRLSAADRAAILAVLPALEALAQELRYDPLTHRPANRPDARGETGSTRT
jgi:DNA-binding MarR family transcriptional regulator